MNEAVTKILEIKVKYDDAIKKMAEYQRNINDAKEREKELKKQLKEGAITRQEYNEQIAASQQYIRLQQNANLQLTRQVMNQIKVQKEQNGSLNQLRAQLSTLTQAYDAMSKAERESAAGKQLKDKINAVTTELKEAEYATQRFYRNVGNYKDAATSLEVLGEKASNLKGLLSSALGGLGIALGGRELISSMTEVGSSFEDQMAKVRAVTNATEEDFAMLREEALRLGGSTRYTATESAEALENLTRNGLSAADATDVLEQTLHLAQANVIELGEAADITTNMLNSFHLEVSDATRVADVMSKTSASSATNISLLNEAMKNTAPLAYTLGISFEETNAALGVLADNNIKGANAGTMLKQILMGLTSPTAAQTAVFKQYGIEIDQNTLRTEGLVATLKRLADSGIMQSANSVKELGDVFGRLAAPSALTLMNSLEGLDEKMLVIGEAAGTTDRMFQQSFGDFTTATDSLRSAWESLLITVFDNNKSTIVGPIQLLTEGIKFVRDNFEEFSSLVANAIAAFSLVKIVEHIRSSASVAGSSVISAAESCTAKVNALSEQEVQQRKAIENMKVQAESASGTERVLLEKKILIQKQQLATTEKNLQKAKTAEIKAYEEAAAFASGSAWQKGMLTAKVAMEGFFNAAKAAAKTFALTAVITIALEGLQMLVKAFKSSGDSMSEFQKQHDATAKAIKEQTASLEHQVAESTAAEITEINTLRNTMNDSNASYDERKKAINRLQSIVPGFHASISREGKLFLQNASAIETYIAKLQKAARAEAAYAMMVKNQEKILSSELTEEDAKQKQRNVRDAAKKRGVDMDAGEHVESRTQTVGTSSFGAVQTSTYYVVVDAKGNEREIAKNVADAVMQDQRWDAMFSERAESQKDTRSQYEQQNKYLESIVKENGGYTEKPSFNPVTDLSHSKGGAGGGSGSGSGRGSGRGSSGGSGADDAAKQEEQRQKILRDGQAALTKMIADNLARQRQQILDSYGNQISDLQKKLETEKKLTADAKQAINNQILALEKERNAKLEALYVERYNKMVEEESKTLALRLQHAQKGSEEQYRLSILSIREEYEKRRKELDSKIIEEQQHIEAIRVEYTIAQQNGATELELAGIQQRMDVERAILDEYSQQTQLINEEQRQREAEAEDEYQTAQMERVRQTYENQVQELMLKKDRTQEEEEEILNLQLQQNEAYLAALEERGQREGQTVEQYNEEIIAAKQRKAEAEKAISEYEIEIEKARYDAASQITGGLVKLTAAIGENNKGFAQLSKIITLAQIAIDTGKAISAGVASASSMPYPSNLVAIATTVATVLANIATAISTVNSAKFAHGGSPNGTGGRVGGPGSKNDKDLITVRVNKDELILNEDQQKRLHFDLTGKGGTWTPDAQRELFGIAEGRIEPIAPFAPITSAFGEIGANVPYYTPIERPDSMADREVLANTLIDGLENMPTPVVSVEDINNGQRRVNVIENIDTL
ncbi:MAG: phage tail tape measure protein [Prevotella sp.]|nr:phage tail tape measure protein [Prevotella sp.]